MTPEALADSLRAVAAAVPLPLLLIGACVGHGFLWIVALNVLYSRPIPNQLLKYTRKFDLLFVLAGPLVFGYALDLFDTGTLTWTPGSPRFLLAPYTVLCWFVGFVVAPLAELAYLLRRTAPQQVRVTAETLDTCTLLGYAPVGKGKKAGLTKLPGNQCFRVEFNEKTLVLPQLPAAWDGLTILHLTDLHLCGTPDRAFYRTVVDRCMAQGVPDLVALTGDVVDSNWHHRWIVPVLGRLRWNVAGLAILGNHDAWRDVSLIRRRLRRVGFKVLGNGWQALDVRGTPLTVIGHEGPWFLPEPELVGCPATPFRLLLSHTPDNLPWALRHRVDLVLAGHVHGGQIRLPLLGSVFVPSRYSRRYDCGTFARGATVMHVGRGLAGQHPLRYFCTPEVTRLVLRQAPG